MLYFVKMHKKRFHDNLKIWIFCNYFVGLFPYQISDTVIKRRKYFNLHVFRCILIYLINEIYFVERKLVLFYFGWVFICNDFIMVFLWLTYWIKNNNRLVAIFLLFNEFDKTFEAVTKKQLISKQIYEFSSIMFLIFLFILDFMATVVMIFIDEKHIFRSVAGSFSRSFERTLMFSFIILYLYLIHNINHRFEKLQEVWYYMIGMKIENTCVNFDLSYKITNIKLLYFHLLDTVELINSCFGSRFVILFAQLFYFVSMYFYVIFSGLNLTTLLPFYVAAICYVAIQSQNLAKSVSIFIILLLIRNRTNQCFRCLKM